MLQDPRIIFVHDIIIIIVVNAGLRESALAQSGNVARICQSIAITQRMPLYKLSESGIFTLRRVRIIDGLGRSKVVRSSPLDVITEFLRGGLVGVVGLSG